jgi:mannose-6-phosphate isomerase-like protein (cupin superfamily)
MVEALRAKLVELHGPMDMTARSIHRIGDWAWLVGQPHEPGSRTESDDVVSALMHQVGRTWQLITMACGEDSEACDESWRNFAKDHPDAPAEIFPNAKPDTKRPKAMLTAQFGGTHLTRPIADLARKLRLAPGETFKIEEVARDASSSHHVVALLDREPLHTHDTHDLLVVVLEGEGEMLIGDHTRSIAAHSIVYVPRHTVHSMHNTTKKPLVGYAIFTPPFDGKDRVLVPEP